MSLWHLGYPDQALKVNREMRQLAREIGHPFSLAYCLHHTAWLYQFCRLGAEVQAAAEEQIAIATEQGFALWHATGTFFKGAGMLLQGRLEESLPLLLKGHRRLPGHRCRATPPVPAQRPGRRLHAGRPVRGGARGRWTRASPWRRRTTTAFQEAELHRLKGELLLAESPDQAAAAEDRFTQAIETARRQQSKAWELRATMSLARLWQRQGRRDEAHRMLAAIHATYHRRSDDAGPRGSRRAAGSLGLTSIALGRHDRRKRVVSERQRERLMRQVRLGDREATSHALAIPGVLTDRSLFLSKCPTSPAFCRRSSKAIPQAAEKLLAAGL